MENISTPQQRETNNDIFDLMINMAKEEGRPIAYHCSTCGIISRDPYCEQKLIDLRELTGKGTIPTKEDFYFGKIPEIEKNYIIPIRDGCNCCEKRFYKGWAEITNAARTRGLDTRIH